MNTSEVVFPEGFYKGASCIRYSWRQLPDIIDYCRSVGQEYYDDLVRWTGKREKNWCYIWGGCLHAAGSLPKGMVEYHWENLMPSDNNPISQIEDIDMLL